MILDNHDLHLSIEVLDYAKDNGIVMLTIPPHCSHKVQPLDCTVFGPFKRYYSTAVKSWMVDNPGKPMTIYNIPQIVAQAFPKAMTMENITAGFRATGIFPYNPSVHRATDFIPSLVTDRPDPNESSAVNHAIPSTGRISVVDLGADGNGPTAVELEGDCQPSFAQETVTVRSLCIQLLDL